MQSPDTDMRGITTDETPHHVHATPPVDADELRESAELLVIAEREVRAAREYMRTTLRRRDDARRHRSDLVRAARDGGSTWKRIADALGVSIPRVRAIYHAAREGRQPGAD